MNTVPLTHQKNLSFFYALANVAVVLMIVAFATAILWQEKKHSENEAKATTQKTASLLSYQLSGIFDEAETLLKAVDSRYREDFNRGVFDPSSFNAYLKQALSWTGAFSNIGFLDSRGIYRYGVDHLKPVSLAERDFFKVLRDRPEWSGSGQTYFSDPIFTALSNRWAIVLASRVENPDGSFAGVLFLRWDVSQLTEILKNIHLPSDKSIALLTDNQVLVSRYPSSRTIDAGIGSRNVSEAFEQTLEQSPIEGTYRTVSPHDHTDRVFSYSKLPHYPFYVLVGKVAGTGLLSSTNNKLVLILASLMILLTTIGTWLIYRQMKARLNDQLNNYANRVLAASPVAMFMLDKNNTILNANPAAIQLFGMGNHSMIGQKADHLNANSENHTTPVDLLNSSRDSSLIRENIFSRPDGTTFTALKSIAALPDSDNKVDYFIETVVDVTTLKLTQEQLRQEANTDKLTGLLNRNAAEYVLNQPVRESLSTDTTFSVIMCDLDHFKRVNDQFGHAAGDVVLKNVAAAMKAAVRAGDYCIRWGGEEFMIVLPGCTIAIAVKLAERTRMDIESQDHGEIGQITMSFGVAQWDKTESVEQLIARADEALYEAKQTGRNRVCAHSHTHA